MNGMTKEELDQVFGCNDNLINRVVNGVESFNAAGDNRITPIPDIPVWQGNPFITGTVPQTTMMGPGFIPNPHMADVILNKMKEVLTVKEFEILMNTNYRSSNIQIRMYCDIIEKLLEQQVFKGDYKTQ